MHFEEGGTHPVRRARWLRRWWWLLLVVVVVVVAKTVTTSHVLCKQERNLQTETFFSEQPSVTTDALCRQPVSPRLCYAISLYVCLQRLLRAVSANPALERCHVTGRRRCTHHSSSRGTRVSLDRLPQFVAFSVVHGYLRQS